MTTNVKNVKDYAVVIGIKHYVELGQLNGPVEDANNFAKWLFKKRGGNLPNDNKHVFVIHSDPRSNKPLQNDIDQALGRIIENGQNTGYRRFYFFFAGHGIGVSWRDNSLCLPGWTSRFINVALSSSHYLDTIVQSGLFDEVLFFLDCCRNRRLGVRGLHPTIGWPEPGPGTANCQSFVAYGAKFDNPAYEAEQWKENELVAYGYFSRALLQGLNGAAGNTQGEITINSLKSFLKTKVEELTLADRISQSVQFEDLFDPNVVLVNGLASKTTRVSISFKRKGRFVLEDPQLNVLKTGIDPAAAWVIDLNKGNYCVKNTTTGVEGFFKVDGTLKQFAYEFKG